MVHQYKNIKFIQKAFIFTALLIGIACSNHSTKRVPKEELVNILADLHLADGALDQSTYKKFHQYDTIRYHEYIYEKYGYTKADVDSSIAHYSYDVESLSEIYDKVTELLQHKSVLLADSMLASGVEPENLWNLKDKWELPLDGMHEKIEVDIPMKDTGIYTFSAFIKLFPDDGSQNPRVNLYFFKEDSTNANGHRIYFRSDFLDKNGIFVRVKIKNELRDSSFTHIRGQILSHTNVNDITWKKHAEVKDIELRFEEFPADTVKTLPKRMRNPFVTKP